MEHVVARRCIGDVHRRKCILETQDGREFHAKSTLSRKMAPLHNPTWLANEIVYWRFAQKAQLRVPYACLVQSDCTFYFGSQSIPAAERVADQSTLKRLLASHGNRVQLVRALLLDLALLNNDRVVRNDLFYDGEGALWFIDHDEALWGDGREPVAPPQPGDLGRIDSSLLAKKFDDFLGDYLHASVANPLVWNQETWEIVLKELRALPLDLGILAEARADHVPTPWLRPKLWQRMEQYLPRWWDRLRTFFLERDDALVHIIGMCKQQKHWAVEDGD